MFRQFQEMISHSDAEDQDSILHNAANTSATSQFFTNLDTPLLPSASSSLTQLSQMSIQHLSSGSAGSDVLPPPPHSQPQPQYLHTHIPAHSHLFSDSVFHNQPFIAPPLAVTTTLLSPHSPSLLDITNGTTL